jgi:hypothetical protein
MLCTKTTVIPNDSFERAHNNGAFGQPSRRPRSDADGPGAAGGSTDSVIWSAVTHLDAPAVAMALPT